LVFTLLRLRKKAFYNLYNVYYKQLTVWITINVDVVRRKFSRERARKRNREKER